MEALQFEVVDKKGEKIICDVIATYHDDEVDKDFLVYTDHTVDENQKINIFYSLYERVDNNIKLIDTTDVVYQKIGLELVKEIISDVHNSC